MKNTLRFNLALMTFVAGVQASAQLVDLPNPMDDVPPGPVAAPTPTGTPIPVTPRATPTPTPTATPSPTPRVVVVIPAPPKATPTPTPTPEVKTARATNYAEILNITRKTGGAWYGIEFVGGTVAEEFYMMGSTNIGVKVHEIRAITESGQSIPLKMSSSIGNVLGYMGTIPQIGNVSNIKRLELRLESMGGVGRLKVQATTFGYLALRPVEAGPQVIVPPPTIPNPQIPSPSGNCASGSTLSSQLRPLKSAMLDWAYETQTTSYGSTSYRRAEQNMNAYGQKMISLVTSQSVLRGSTDEIKSLAQDYAYEMNTASYGSLIYKVYNHIAATAYGAIPTSLNMALQCRSWSFKQILDAATDYAYEAQASSYGSMANTAFTKSAQILYNLAPSRYQQEARGKDYQQFLNDMKNYAYEQNTTSYGSIQYTTYEAIKVRAGNLAQAAFRMYVFRLNRNQRQRLAQDYQYEMQTTSYGGYEYQFYQAMMNIALGR